MPTQVSDHFWGAWPASHLGHSESCKNITSERTRSWPIICSPLTAKCFGSLHHDHRTSEIHLMQRQRPTTGSMKTGKQYMTKRSSLTFAFMLMIGYGMRKTETMKLEEHKCTCYKASSWETTYLEWRQCWHSCTSRWLQESGTFETHTKSWILERFHLVKFCKQPGTEKWFSSGAWLRVKLVRPTLYRNLLNLTRRRSLPSLMPETRMLLSVLQFVLT